MNKEEKRYAKNVNMTRAVAHLTAVAGRAPTYNELSTFLGIPLSNSTYVRWRCAQAMRDGLMVSTPRKHRSLRLTPAGVAAIAEVSK